jgi:hypothetical protein
MQTTTQQQVTYTQHSSVKHTKHFSIAQRNALNALNIVRYTAAQVTQAQQLAQALHKHFSITNVHVNYNANSIAVKVSNCTATQLIQYYAKQHSASIKQTANNVLLHIAQH